VRLTARVPATSANLGPGFDCFGLALDLCNEITVDTEAEPGVSWEGEGADELPTDGSDLASRAMRHAEAFAAAEGADVLPPFHLRGTNRIPLASGLGSSSAAVVAGVALAYALLDLVDGPHDPETTYAIAAQMEGHPDNAAAAVFGGFTIALPDGSVRRLDPHPDLRPVALVPEGVRVPTAEARRALPVQVPLEDAAFNAAHAALTVEALTVDPDHLWASMRDRLHQDVRLALVPAAREMFDRMREASFPVCVSGAGPTLLAFEPRDRPIPDPGEGWRALRLPVRPTGVEIVEA
jgi:homoserine kinase